MSQPKNVAPKQSDAETESTGALPRPIIRKMRWPFPLIWVVPVVAAALTGYFLYERHRERGREITIEFTEAPGLKPGESA